MASKQGKLHGRIDGSATRCAVPGCGEPGEFKAPVRPSDFDGPGDFHLLCLDHVREHNSKYNYFHGMSAEEITAAQGPLAGWERPSRKFAHVGADPAPAWADFSDPLDAIAARFRTADRGPPERFSKSEKRALSALGLGQEVDLNAVRRRYSQLVRRYHPDRNGGDRTHEKKLGEVIGAWQTLKTARAFAA